jgi:hypothetical protein
LAGLSAAEIIFVAVAGNLCITFHQPREHLGGGGRIRR